MKTKDTIRTQIALRDHVINEYHGRLEGAVAVMSGEAEELANRRPHRHIELYYIEEQLRWKATNLREFINENTESYK